jgi:hypothetical protein
VALAQIREGVRRIGRAVKAILKTASKGQLLATVR